MEEKNFWEIVEIQCFIYNDGEEIAEGYGYTLFSHIYHEDIDEYDIEYEDPEDIIVNGKSFEIDYDEISWENQEVVDGPFEDYDEACKSFKSYLL